MTIINLTRGGENNMELVWYFIAGFFAFNGIPHLVKGITGQNHMTPFKRVSPPTLNVVWAFVNEIIALFILGIAVGTNTFTLPANANLTGINLWAFLVGGFAVSFYLANFWSNPNARLPWHKD